MNILLPVYIMIIVLLNYIELIPCDTVQHRELYMWFDLLRDGPLYYGLYYLIPVKMYHYKGLFFSLFFMCIVNAFSYALGGLTGYCVPWVIFEIAIFSLFMLYYRFVYAYSTQSDYPSNDKTYIIFHRPSGFLGYLYSTLNRYCYGSCSIMIDGHIYTCGKQKQTYIYREDHVFKEINIDKEKAKKFLREYNKPYNIYHTCVYKVCEMMRDQGYSINAITPIGLMRKLDKSGN